MKILKDIILAPFTTFGIGGKADYFCEAKNKEEIIESVKWAKNHQLDYLIIGQGSNILIADKGVRGLVIKIKNETFVPSSGRGKLKVEGNNIMAEAGVSLSQLIQYSLDHCLSGLECLAGIPGTVGGAVAGNAGAKTGSISQAIVKVKVLGEDGQIKDLNSTACNFDYRQSRFQKTKEIILEAVFSLKKERRELIRKNINKALELRKNQPPGKSAGSIFKNPVLAPAGYLIENAGLKGKKIGSAAVSNNHANWIINTGQAKASDVLKLIAVIKAKVKRDFKVKLEEEIVFKGDF